MFSVVLFPLTALALLRRLSICRSEGSMEYRFSSNRGSSASIIISLSVSLTSIRRHEHCSGDRRLERARFSTGPGFHLAQPNRINSKFQLPKEPNQHRLSKHIDRQIAVRLIVYKECSSQLSLGL